MRNYRCLCNHRHTCPMSIAHCSFWAQWHRYKLLTLSGWTSTTFEARFVNVLSNLSSWMLPEAWKALTMTFCLRICMGALGEGFATSTRWPAYDENLIQVAWMSQNGVFDFDNFLSPPKLDYRNFMNGDPLYLMQCSHLKRHWDSLITSRAYSVCNFPPIYM